MHEAMIKLVTRISAEWPDLDTDRLVAITDEIMYDYEIGPREHGLTVLNDMRDKILLYVGSKKLDGLSDLTLKNYLHRLTLFASFLHKNIEDITTMDIRRFLAAYGTGSGCQRSTMGTVISILKSFFTWMQDQEYITKNPMRPIKATKVEKKLRKSLSEEELEKLRDACQTLRERAVVEMYYSTGCRLSELASLSLGAINWQELSFTVLGKGSKERTVYFTPRAKLHLQKYLASRRRASDNEPLFVISKEPFNRMSNRAIQEEVDRIATRAKFDRSVHPHMLRHTLATLGLKHGASLTTIQTTLGHSSPATTMVYAQADSDNVRNEFRKHMAQ